MPTLITDGELLFSGCILFEIGIMGDVQLEIDFEIAIGIRNLPPPAMLRREREDRPHFPICFMGLYFQAVDDATSYITQITIHPNFG